jgi:hypothetical protein
MAVVELDLPLHQQPRIRAVAGEALEGLPVGLILPVQAVPASSLFAGLQTPLLLQAPQVTHRFYTITDTRFMSGLLLELLLFKE